MLINTGYYIYTEASGNSNKTARIISPVVRTTGTLCVSFWYHMYGVHINTLNMYLKNNGALNNLWTKSGNQGNKWINGLVDINSVNGNQVRKLTFEHCLNNKGRKANC